MLKDTLSLSTHGSTFGGNPLACAVALEVLNIVPEKDFLKNVIEMGNHFKNKLKLINGVSNVRGLGLMIGFEVNNISASDLAFNCVENGLLILTAKDSIRFLPPLNISLSDINKGLSIFENTLKNSIDRRI